MAQRVLELTLVSASNLPDVNTFSDMKAYAVASINGDSTTRQRTITDRDGKTHPTWDPDDTLCFTVPPTAAAASAAGAYLHVLIRTERFFGDDRDVGEVFIPLADLFAEACAGATQPRCASYQVRKVQCTMRRGMLCVSYRLGPVMAPLVPDTDSWDDDNQLPPFQCYPPPYSYTPEYKTMVPRYPRAGVRMPPPPKPAGFYAADASLGTKDIKKNGSFSLGLGAGLLGGGFGRMLFSDSRSSDTAAYDSGSESE